MIGPKGSAHLREDCGYKGYGSVKMGHGEYSNNVIQLIWTTHIIDDKEIRTCHSCIDPTRVGE